MNVHDAIYIRRSIRRYQNKPLPEEIIWQLIQAAAQAPSAKNRQPWFFYIIRDQTVKKKLVESLDQGIDAVSYTHLRAHETF